MSHQKRCKDRKNKDSHRKPAEGELCFSVLVKFICRERANDFFERKTDELPFVFSGKMER